MSTPTVGKDLLYAGTDGGDPAAVDPDTGAVVWVTGLAAVTGTAGAVSTPTVGKDLLYAGTAGGDLAALA